MWARRFAWSLPGRGKRKAWRARAAGEPGGLAGCHWRVLLECGQKEKRGGLVAEGGTCTESNMAAPEEWEGKVQSAQWSCRPRKPGRSELPFSVMLLGRGVVNKVDKASAVGEPANAAKRPRSRLFAWASPRCKR